MEGLGFSGVFILVILISFSIIVLTIADESPRKHFKQKIRYAHGSLIHSLGKKLMKLGRSIAEEPNEREYREALECLIEQNRRIYKYSYTYLDSEFRKDYIQIEKIKHALTVVKYSFDYWKITAEHLYYLGILHKYSRCGYQDFFAKDNDKSSREYFMTEWINRKNLKNNVELLIKALNHFEITQEEWVDLGINVVYQKDLINKLDLHQYGTWNNLHNYSEEISLYTPIPGTH